MATSASAPTVRAFDARSPRSVTAASRTVATPKTAISPSKTSRNPCSSWLRSAGTVNAGSAPGGYSGLMSRYGTAPSSIAVP